MASASALGNTPYRRSKPPSPTGIPSRSSTTFRTRPGFSGERPRETLYELVEVALCHEGKGTSRQPSLRGGTLPQLVPADASKCYAPPVTTEEIARGVRFVVDGEGHVTSVVLTPDLWRKLVGQLEDSEDKKLLEAMAPKLAKGPSGALRWSDVEQDWA